MKTSLYILVAGLGIRLAAGLQAAQDTGSEKFTPPADLAEQADEKLKQASSPQDYEDAAALLKKAAKADPANMDVRLTLGWVYLDKLHDPHAASHTLKTVVKQRPGDVNARKLLGMAFIQTGYPHDAAVQFRAASLLEPDDLWIRANLGRALAKEGKHAEARAIFEGVLKKDSTNADARLGQAELAAWSGRSGTALEMLDQLLKENPTNVEALVLRGDVRHWNWQLTGARADYQQALDINPQNYPATKGLDETKKMGDSDVTLQAYEFKDSTDFQRESGGLGARIHLSDQAYFLAHGAGWHFTNPGFSDVDRLDGAAGFEFDWSRWLQSSLEGDIFNYIHQSAVYGGKLSLKASPVPERDFYLVLAGRQPFVSSMATVTNGLKEDSIGFGMDAKLVGRLSVQNDLRLARISDHNTWWEEKPQLSFRVFDKPQIFIRGEYDYLSYERSSTEYWTPTSRNVASPVLSAKIPFGKLGDIKFDARMPYVFDADNFGYQIEGGPTLYLSSHVELGGSYIYASIPGDKGVSVGANGSSTPPWSGQGGQAYLRVRF
jgi:tetratricopeptide (TPR) repeat protein